ncbi:hypothetical protein LEP1GSC047_1552 [Leptospira inadai serovar Lyme str. 10]|uniref:Uncharacterized protein n=1 Tax=Leptospira inadai serovar Lyme str. 10 TaxID=1049790 RepID=V6HH15_9LEPT|nr:hypothetical protein LEP1GSC047_1552 [Leptospira inadai serovar Lyme str. 10]
MHKRCISSLDGKNRFRQFFIIRFRFPRKTKKNTLAGCY